MNKKVKAFISSALIGGMLLGAGNMVLAQNAPGADSSSKAAVVEKAPFRGGFRCFQGGNMFFSEDLLSELTEEGIITSEQAEKIRAYIEEKREQAM